MNNSLLFVAVFLCLFIIIACENTNTPSKTAKTYLNNIKNGKYEEAVKLLDLQEYPSADEMKELLPKFQEGINQKQGIKKYTVTEEKYTDGDKTKAEVTVHIKYGDETETDAHYKMTKTKKGWKLTLGN